MGFQLMRVGEAPAWRPKADESDATIQSDWPSRCLKSSGDSWKRLEGNHMADQHLKYIRPVTPSAEGCEECLKTGSSWVHLRLCLTCGHVGCCDSSPNRHATKHFHHSQHPIIQSFEPGEDWRWCYVDESYV